MRLRTITAEPLGEGIVEHLEAVLTQANEGQLSSVAIAIVHRDGSTEGVWSAAPSRVLLLGALTRLVHKLNLQVDK